MREKGLVKTYFKDRGFGFIARIGAPDVFFHINQVYWQDEPVLINHGALAEFVVQDTSKGWRALAVVLV